MTAALYAVARAIDEDRSRASAAWAAAAGLAALAAVIVRPIGLFVLPVLVLAVLLAAAPSARVRIARAGALTAVVAAGMLGYFALNASQTGTFGLAEGSGWNTYARAAPFADCRVFTPPAGSEGLCETSDAREREGPDSYAWGERSPGRRLFIGPPYHGHVVGAWARAAIAAQPRAYLQAVARDLWRYVDAGAPPRRPGFGDGPRLLGVDRRTARFERLNREQVAPFYGHYAVEVRGAAGTLGDVQRVVRVHGPLLLVAVMLSLAALPVASGRARIAILLLGGGSVLTLLLATATLIYNWRYAVPVSPFLMASGAIGLQELAGAVARRRRRGSPGAPL
jgi:hypothetical protein